MKRRLRRVSEQDPADAYASRDLPEDELDVISGGIPETPHGWSSQVTHISQRPDLPLFMTRPTDNLDLWF